MHVRGCVRVYSAGTDDGISVRSRGHRRMPEPRAKRCKHCDGTPPLGRDARVRLSPSQARGTLAPVFKLTRPILTNVLININNKCFFFFYPLISRFINQPLFTPFCGLPVSEILFVVWCLRPPLFLFLTCVVTILLMIDRFVYT